MNNKQNRNDKCNCNSGKKYKHCCYSKDQITNALNSLGVNKLHGWGAFYKDNNDDGFSMFIDGEAGELILDNIEKCTQAELNDIKSGEITLEQLTNDVLEQLHNMIPQWNELVFGTTKRPMGEMAKPKLDNEDIITLTTCICQDIHFLDTVKAITNDEYNGMSYAYTK